MREGWKLWGLPWWFWLVLAVPELLLLIPLAWSRPRHQLEQLGHRRTVALTLLGVISIGNAIALLALIGSVLSDQERDGTELLIKGVAVWTHERDRVRPLVLGRSTGAAPSAAASRIRRRPDFQFPQMENPQLAAPGWHPRLFDYMYVSFTNAIAFSPTDAMPLTRWAKALMLVESAASAVTVVLVAARAVNILR